jgi:hypothetical protein
MVSPAPAVQHLAFQERFNVIIQLGIFGMNAADRERRREIRMEHS